MNESAVATESDLLPRPQPVGVFPMPAGYLLIGGGRGHDEVRRLLVDGKRPAEFPETLRWYEHALDGDIEAAVEALDGDDLVTLTNRFVLDPDRELLQHLRSTATGDVAAHVEMVAFVVGLALDPPDPASTDGELAALAHAAVATLALERKDIDAAATALEEGARLAMSISRPLAGQLLGQLANVQLDDGGVKRAQTTFQAAIDCLVGTDLRVSEAELRVSCGAMYQEMSEAAPRLLKMAIDHYHAALQLIDITSSPESYGVANANLGLAYLTMPMTEASDLLRVGIAVQALREALKVFTPESHRDRWSSTQLNLANALVYMPSTHQAENIAEAVGLYEAVLQHRDRHRDPHGRARVLANQGNALAHLGVFDEAKLRLHEARMIFEEFDEHEMVRNVRSILDEVAKQESIVRQDSA